jgi:sulfatase maturation enzyme AslB (radical SAM superfamily)
MFPMTLDKIFQALKPGGFLFSMWSPIWSAYNGHHLPTMVDKFGKEMNFGNSPIPPWGHLLMRPPELYEYLLKFTDSESAAKIVYFVYHSPHINRLFTEDYIRFINDSRLEQKEVTGIFPSPIKPEIQRRLEELYPGRKHFANNGLMVVLERPAQSINNMLQDESLKKQDKPDTITVKLNKEQYALVLKAQDFLKRNDNVPPVLLIEISTNCNAKCIFCPRQYGIWKNKWKRTIIKDEFFYNAVDQFREMGGKYVSLTPMQGEPLLDKNILKKIKYAKGFDLLYFYTNATLLDRFDLDELLESGMTNIRISTTFPDRDYFFKVFGTDRYNIPNIGNLLKTFANSKSSTVKRISIEFRSGIPLPRIYEQYDFKKYIQPYLSNRVEISNMNFFDSFNGIIKESNLLQGMIIKEDNVRPRLIPCVKVYNVYVGVDGDLRLCGCRFDPFSEVDELHVGNMRTTTLKDALNSAKAKSIVSSFLSLKNLSLCQRCSWYETISRMPKLFDK